MYFLTQYNTTQNKSQEEYNIGRTELLPVPFLKNKSTCMNFQDHGLCYIAVYTQASGFPYNLHKIRLAITSSLQLVYYSVAIAAQEFPSRLLNNITTLLNHNWKNTWSLTKLYEYCVVGVCPEIYGALGRSALYLCAKSKIDHS